jgi:hypothetical protein
MGRRYSLEVYIGIIKYAPSILYNFTKFNEVNEYGQYENKKNKYLPLNQ